MWLLKRSIYGRMDEQDKKIEKQKEEMKDLQTKPICALMQAACQKLLLEKMDSVAMISSREVEAIDGKLDLVLNSMNGLISRIDKHLNGHDYKE